MSVKDKSFDLDAILEEAAARKRERLAQETADAEMGEQAARQEMRQTEQQRVRQAAQITLSFLMPTLRLRQKRVFSKRNIQTDTLTVVLQRQI